MEKKILKKYKIPDKPGVYFFLKKKEVLYIGKATSLKSRVKSYFTPDLSEKRGPLLVDMLAKADKIEWQETESVLEALILEAKLIKRHQPKYNTEGKSDKSWNYVCITKDEPSKILLVRERQLHFDKSSFRASFGPFTNGGQLKEAMKIIRKIFPYLDGGSKSNYEFYRQLGLAPDMEKKKMYQENLKNIKLLFEGKKKKVLKELEKKMKEAAKAREFELAGEFKRQLFALGHINDVALLKSDTKEDKEVFRIEAYDIAHMGGKNMVGVMTVIENGRPAKSEYRKFKIRTKKEADDTGALAEVLERRLNHPQWRYPNLIVVDGGIAQINTARKMLEKAGIGINIVSVVKDERHRPKGIRGDRQVFRKYESEILLANSEAHRFAISYHKNLRGKSFLKL